ncbi:hypothetical protein [Bacillus cereus]|uniref:Uncharacterized protein n=1 Tax=Bacillus cereus TaxID=1396 RepID=A0A164QDW3_BACCE|nr:hypothetical protein [Bacillus cereus]KZD71175.1 hypothetical protein B4088_0905 [Bacillus cereus]
MSIILKIPDEFGAHPHERICCENCKLEIAETYCPMPYIKPINGASQSRIGTLTWENSQEYEGEFIEYEDSIDYPVIQCGKCGFENELASFLAGSEGEF